MDTLSQLAASVIDPQLVARVAKGEHQALSRLYDQSSTVLFSLALRILGDRKEAADVLHGIYLDAWRKVVRYDIGRGTPIAWLITLTRNVLSTDCAHVALVPFAGWTRPSMKP